MGKKEKVCKPTPIRFPSDQIDFDEIEIVRAKISGRYHFHCNDKDHIDIVNIYLNKSNTEELLRLLDLYIDSNNEV